MGEATCSYVKISTKIKERGANQRTSRFSLMSRPQTTSSPDDQTSILDPQNDTTTPTPSEAD